MIQRLVLASLLLAGGCSLFLKYNECNSQQDCANRTLDGGAQGITFSCTTDHLCVPGLPDEQLCQEPMAGLNYDTAAAAAMAGDPKVITFGAIFRRTGPSADKDLARVNAIGLALTDVNNSSPQKFAVVLCDQGDDPINLQRDHSFHRLVEHYHVPAILGPPSSGDADDLAQLALPARVTMMTPCATVPTYTGYHQSGNSYVWRTAPNDLYQAKALVQNVPSAGKIDMLYKLTTANKTLHDAFVNELAAQNKPALHTQTPYDDTMDPTQLVLNFAADVPDVVVILTDADAPSILKSMATSSAPFANAQIMLTDKAMTSKLFSQGTKDPTILARILGTSTPTPDGKPGYMIFQNEYVNSPYNMNPLGSTTQIANSYDAFFALAAVAAAARQSGVAVTGTSVVLGLQRLSSLTAPMTDVVGGTNFPQVVKQIADGNNVNLVGASGPLVFDPATGDLKSQTIALWKVDLTDPANPNIVTVSTVAF